MIRRIREHNQLNGIAFSTVEYAIAALAAGFIAFAFGLNGRWLGLALSIGIVINCLIVVGFGVAAWRRGERGSSLGRLADPEYRRQVRRDHPSLMQDTLTLAIVAIVPFALTIGVVADVARGDG